MNPSLNAPIIFSITGHRGIAESMHADLKKHLVSLFKEFKIKYPETEIRLMSALAEGGDTIAAEAANQADVDVIAVLPMNVSDYIETFDGGQESIEKFNRMLSESSNRDDPYILPGAGSDLERYRALGRFLVSNSHILIALWDGIMLGPDGGSSDVARMGYLGIDWNSERDKVPSEEGASIDYLDIADTCLVYHIPVKREDDEKISVSGHYIMPVETPGGIGIGMELATEYPDKVYDSIPEYFSNVFSYINELNSDSLRNYRCRPMSKNADGVGIAEEVIQSLNTKETFHLLPEDGSEAVYKIKKSPKLSELSGRFAIADKLALKYQRKSFRVKNVYLALVTLSNLFLVLYLIFAELFIILAYAVFMTVSTIAYWYVAKYRKREYHVKSIEYRNIAEIMRVKYYWSIAGVLCPISNIFSEYRRNPTETTRSILKGWAHTLHPSDKLDVPDDEKIRLVKDAWVEGQEKYHLKKKIENRKRISFHERSERTFQIISIAISVFIVGIGFITEQTSFRILSLTAVATLLLLNFIMSFTGIIARMESTILASHIYGGSPDEIGMKENMFRVAKIRMDRLVPDSGVMDDQSVEASKKILYELGIMSIEECNDWAATHMSKDIRPPAPRNE